MSPRKPLLVHGYNAIAAFARALKEDCEDEEQELRARKRKKETWSN